MAGDAEAQYGHMPEGQQLAGSYGSSRAGSGAKHGYIKYNADDSTRIERSYVEQVLGLGQQPGIGGAHRF